MKAYVTNESWQEIFLSVLKEQEKLNLESIIFVHVFNLRLMT